jgi:hypothetical protein
MCPACDKNLAPTIASDVQCRLVRVTSSGVASGPENLPGRIVQLQDDDIIAVASPRTAADEPGNHVVAHGITHHG